VAQNGHALVEMGPAQPREKWLERSVVLAGEYEVGMPMRRCDAFKGVGQQVEPLLGVNPAEKK
jgi:hypothetical protein